MPIVCQFKSPLILEFRHFQKKVMPPSCVHILHRVFLFGTRQEALFFHCQAQLALCSSALLGCRHAPFFPAHQHTPGKKENTNNGKINHFCRGFQVCRIRVGKVFSLPRGPPSRCAKRSSRAGHRRGSRSFGSEAVKRAVSNFIGAGHKEKRAQRPPQRGDVLLGKSCVWVAVQPKVQPVESHAYMICGSRG